MRNACSSSVLIELLSPVEISSMWTERIHRLGSNVSQTSKQTRDRLAIDSRAETRTRTAISVKASEDCARSISTNASSVLHDHLETRQIDKRDLRHRSEHVAASGSSDARRSSSSSSGAPPVQSDERWARREPRSLKTRPHYVCLIIFVGSAIHHSQQCCQQAGNGTCANDRRDRSA
jgi:hypothetical protein